MSEHIAHIAFLSSRRENAEDAKIIGEHFGSAEEQARCKGCRLLLTSTSMHPLDREDPPTLLSKEFMKYFLVFACSHVEEVVCKVHDARNFDPW